MLSCGVTDMVAFASTLDNNTHFKFPQDSNGTNQDQVCEAEYIAPLSLNYAKLIPCLFFSFIHQESLMPVFSELKPTETPDNDIRRMKIVDGSAVFFVYRTNFTKKY